MADLPTPTPAGASEEKAVITPVEPTAGEPDNQPEPKPVAAGAAVAPNPEEDKATLDKRLKGAISKVEQANADLAKAVDVQVAIVQENPELIHKIAGADPKMANRIIEKLWGERGIKTYKHLQEAVEMEELKKQNPVAYESKREMAELKKRLDDREAKDRDYVMNQFLATQGIQKNDYDPNFKRLQEALDSINPAIVASDYGRALELAHKIAFGGGQVSPGAEAPTMSYGSGQPSTLPNSKPRLSEQTAWLANEFKKKGYAMKSF